MNAGMLMPALISSMPMSGYEQSFLYLSKILKLPHYKYRHGSLTYQKS
jgi:hypothetical protein